MVTMEAAAGRSSRTSHHDHRLLIPHHTLTHMLQHTCTETGTHTQFFRPTAAPVCDGWRWTANSKNKRGRHGEMGWGGHVTLTTHTMHPPSPAQPGSWPRAWAGRAGRWL